MRIALAGTGQHAACRVCGNASCLGRRTATCQFLSARSGEEGKLHTDRLLPTGPGKERQLLIVGNIRRILIDSGVDSLILCVAAVELAGKAVLFRHQVDC
jgi:hypothetical protein